ncbi:biotin-dependent carboxyltransferase family protein [Photobacterium aquimaris]|uniref:Allophanate hydrolase n=1 Tax=Photobacterium aquimaris TaxID=512643 RepID=A0A2T3HU48_9GAMM|nr:biotin-dependent carboxyltransferase family protein [Photobacterium aquimaris]MCP4954920.1 biotin-dependent carboxyltransferase [Photobacterium aquimaris]OBU19031.1 allophanate hydrolase [Photobacterium aquimaris]PQJ41451.1 allophanate hydrolase [Photobacterium aquimaris]PST99919.1 allophanate hydrolase [Photobacterium aquimaris]
MSRLAIINPGILSLIQDLGRYGGAQQGITQGGAMDLHAFCWANYLLSNDSNAAQLELTVGLACFEALDDCQCALAGANMAATIDGQPIAPWQSFLLKKGQILQFRAAKYGLRAYLAIRGGFKIPKVLGSAATVMREQLGGLDHGQPLTSNTVLEGNKVPLLSRYSIVPTEYIPDYSADVVLSVIEAYQAECFTHQQKKRFYRQHYQVTSASDRMGCRLEGEKIVGVAMELISQPIATGAIQIPPDGLPIILLNDRQTLGGYPILGCITRMDVLRLAQVKPNDKVQFKAIDAQLLIDYQQRWMDFCRFFTLPF